MNGMDSQSRFASFMALAKETPFDVSSRIKGDVGEIRIYGMIGPNWATPAMVAKACEDCEGTKTLDVYFNTPGGFAHDGNAIYALLRRQKQEVRTHSEGLTASAGAMAFLAGDIRTMPPYGASIMLHDPWGHALIVGNLDESERAFEKFKAGLKALQADFYGIVADRTKMTRSEAESALSKETYYTAQQALEAGVITKIDDGRKAKTAPKSYKALAEFHSAASPLAGISFDGDRIPEWDQDSGRLGSLDTNATNPNDESMRFLSSIALQQIARRSNERSRD